MRRFLTIIQSALLLLLASCIHKGFDYSRFGYVEVVFDWRYAPDADPASMTLFMYPEGGGDPLRYDFAGRDGGIIEIAPGVYNAICINSDKRDVIYENQQLFDAFEVTTPSLSSVTFDKSFSCRASELPGTEGSVMMMQPPMLWSSSETGFKVTVSTTPRPVSGKGKATVDHQVLTMYPKPIVDIYEVTVKNVRNSQFLKTLSGTINNMSDGYLAGPQKDTDTSVILNFGLNHDVEKANAQGRFQTFGHCPNERGKHRLILYAILTDGSKYYYEFDVSDQAHNPPDENGIYHIVVEFLDIEEPTGSGMAPNVNEWTSVDIYVPM